MQQDSRVQGLVFRSAGRGTPRRATNRAPRQHAPVGFHTTRTLAYRICGGSRKIGSCVQHTQTHTVTRPGADTNGIFGPLSQYEYGAN